jgi:hypothetical protein
MVLFLKATRFVKPKMVASGASPAENQAVESLRLRVQPRQPRCCRRHFGCQNAVQLLDTENRISNRSALHGHDWRVLQHAVSCLLVHSPRRGLTLSASACWAGEGWRSAAVAAGAGGGGGRQVRRQVAGHTQALEAAGGCWAPALAPARALGCLRVEAIITTLPQLAYCCLSYCNAYAALADARQHHSCPGAQST